MLQRQTIRVLIVFSQTMYFLDGAERKGITYDVLQAFEGRHTKNSLAGRVHRPRLGTLGESGILQKIV